jgi:hypothetical protein
MLINFSDQIRRYLLYGIALVGTLLILFFGMSGAHAAHAQGAAKIASRNILTPKNTSESNTYNTHIFPLLKDGDIWVVDEINGTQQQLTYNGMNYSPILAPNGSRIAYIATSQDHQPGNDVSANINIIDVDGKNPITFATGVGLVSLPSWSPDSNQLAFVKGTQLVTVNLQDLSSHVLSNNASFDNSIGIPNPVWSPSGKNLLCVLKEDQISQLWSIDIDTGTKNPVITKQYKDAPYGFSPAGDITYIQKDSSGKTNLYLKTAGLVAKVLLDDVIDFAWSPGGNTLTVRRSDRSLWVFRISDKYLQKESEDGEILLWINDSQFVYRANDGIHIASTNYSDNRKITASQLSMEVQAVVYATLDTPWRTQNSGICADGNCGPASLGMTMDYFGVHFTNDSIRRQINIYMNGDQNDCGSSGASWDSLQWFATTKAGLATVGWSSGWSLDGISSQIAQGHPVVLLVHYRSLPGHENDSYAYDHYIVFEGIRNDGMVVYDDPDYLTAADGDNRTMTQQQLITAWSSNVSGNPQYSAMAVKNSSVAVPGAFNKNNPTNESSDVAVAPTLSWGTSTDATSYEYCYATTTGCTSWASVGTNTSVAISGLDNVTTYYWQVRAVNAGGTTQADSGTYWYFTTIMAAPGAFGKTDPSDGATDVATNPTLNWDTSTYATSYEYCYATTSDCSVFTPVGTDTSVGLSGLSNSQVYYWQVRAVNAGGTTPANTGTYWSFTTAAPTPPGIFSKISPLDGATGVAMNTMLSWSTSSNATSYEYCYSTTNPCSSWISTTSTSSAILALSANTTYYWQVRANNGAGTTEADEVTTYWSFTTAAVPPPDSFLKSSPTNGTSDVAVNPTLNWGTSTDATSYEYCYATTTGCTSWASVGTNTSVAISGLDNVTTYYWQVRAVNAGGTTQADSGTYWSFTTQAKPVSFTNFLPIIYR